jgi:hypothetical protein
MRWTYIAMCALLCVGANIAFAQQQVDPRYLVEPLRTQRTNALDGAALCSGLLAAAQDEVAALKKRIADLEAKASEAK